MDPEDKTIENVIAFPEDKLARLLNEAREEADSSSILEDEMPFCEEGSRLAMNLMRTTHMAVEYSDTYNPDRIRRSVNASLEEFLQHRAECKLCKEEFD